jgi:hypothetical protein
VQFDAGAAERRLKRDHAVDGAEQGEPRKRNHIRGAKRREADGRPRRESPNCSQRVAASGREGAAQIPGVQQRLYQPRPASEGVRAILLLDFARQVFLVRSAGQRAKGFAQSGCKDAQGKGPGLPADRDWIFRDGAELDSSAFHELQFATRRAAIWLGHEIVHAIRSKWEPDSTGFLRGREFASRGWQGHRTGGPARIEAKNDEVRGQTP